MKYNFNNFNVAHFSWLDAPELAPSPDIMCFSWLFLSLVSGRIALGIAHRWESLLLTGTI
jgi:hypothetical protein